MTRVFDTLSKACLVLAFILLMPVTALTVAEVRFGYHSYAQLSDEMGPVLPAGSLVVTHPVGTADLAVGDVIAFHAPGSDELVTRRVSKLVFQDAQPTELIVTRADSASADDRWRIPGNALVDREVLSVPFAGYPAAALQTTLGRFTFLVLPAALLLLLFVTAAMRRRRRRRLVLLEAA